MRNSSDKHHKLEHIPHALKTKSSVCAQSLLLFDSSLSVTSGLESYRPNHATLSHIIFFLVLVCKLCNLYLYLKNTDNLWPQLHKQFQMLLNRNKQRRSGWFLFWCLCYHHSLPHMNHQLVSQQPEVPNYKQTPCATHRKSMLTRDKSTAKPSVTLFAF